MKNTSKSSTEALATLRADDLLIVELDDRMEFTAAVLVADNYGCNDSKCVQNGYCPVKG